MYIVGLTGGIGSGKTAASDAFVALGIEVVDADICARIVVEKGRPALAAIAEHFGAEFLTASGELDRAALRRLIFSDVAAKKWLEALLHPLIFSELCAQLESAKSPYALLVSPLLIESQQYLVCDRVLVVDVPEALQIERTMQRDSNDRAQVEAIMASQTSREKRLSLAQDVLENTQDLAYIHAEVERLHRQYLQLADAKRVVVRK